MKRCPECGREYDDWMMFCLDDGAELLYGPAARSEPATAILSESRSCGSATGSAVSGSSTRAQFNATDETAVLPTGTGDHCCDATRIRQTSSRRASVTCGDCRRRILRLSIFSVHGRKADHIDRGTPVREHEWHCGFGIPFRRHRRALIYRLSQVPDLKVAHGAPSFDTRAKI